MEKAEPVFERYAARDREVIEERLRELVGRLAGEHPGMREAVEYSVLGGGKRLRPLLCLWTHDAFGGVRRDVALDCACALECVHAYSLVHDDLPCMDDDDLRRGKPSAHRKYGEAIAVLTGDALLTLAFEILATLPERHAVSAELALSVVRVVALASGSGGLITGQALDLAPPPARDLAAVDRIHAHKTARLVAASMEAGALVAGADEATRARVGRAGMAAGSAFQIVDDLLDLEGSEDSLGKTPGKDVNDGKLTFPSVAGVAAAREESECRIDAALAMLPEAAERPLASLLAFFVGRSS